MMLQVLFFFSACTPHCTAFIVKTLPLLCMSEYFSLGDDSAEDSISISGSLAQPYLLFLFFPSPFREQSTPVLLSMTESGHAYVWTNFAVKGSERLATAWNLFPFQAVELATAQPLLLSSLDPLHGRGNQRSSFSRHEDLTGGARAGCLGAWQQSRGWLFAAYTGLPVVRIWDAEKVKKEGGWSRAAIRIYVIGRARNICVFSRDVFWSEIATANTGSLQHRLASSQGDRSWARRRAHGHVCLSQHWQSCCHWLWQWDPGDFRCAGACKSRADVSFAGWV